jgi:hypothetical protein
MKHTLVLASLIVMTFASCSESTKAVTPGNKDIVGVYRGRYYDGYETVEMRPDGTFKQTFVKNGNIVYTHEGKWKFSPPVAVDLAPFMRLIDLSGKTVLTGKPSLSEGMAADFRRDPDRIEFGAWPYIVAKKNDK